MNCLFSEEEYESSTNRDLLPLQCIYCLNTYFTTKRNIYQTRSGKYVKVSDYCSRQCKSAALKIRVSVSCNNCGKLFLKREKERNKTFYDYCSLSCSAIVNNRNYPKKTFDLDLTLEETNLRYVQDKSTIRNQARAIYKKSGRSFSCYVCGYDKHIEICHIKPIKEFKSFDLIKDINALSNLIALCPNHHWEFDNGLLELEDIT